MVATRHATASASILAICADRLRRSALAISRSLRARAESVWMLICVRSFFIVERDNMPGPKTCQYLFLIIFTYPGEGQKDALPARCGRKGKAGGSPLSLLAIMPWQARCENGLALYCWPPTCTS